MSESEPSSPDIEPAVAEKSVTVERLPSKDGKSAAGARSCFYDIILVLLLSTAQFTTQAGVGGTLAILHIIGDDLGVTEPAKLSWLMASYSLTVGTFILPSGRLGDVLSHKLMLTVGFCWFALWTLVAGFAVYGKHGYTLFVLARALQGIGPAICLPNALAILGREYEKGKKKNIVFAVFGATAPLGSVVGAVVASLWGQYVWWPWAFWSFAVVLGVIAAVIGPIVPTCHLEHERPKGIKDVLTRIDAMGCTLGVASLVLFNFAWNQAPVSGWSDPAVIVTLVLGLLMAPVFFLYEKRSTHPILPVECLNGQIAAMLACIGLGWSCFGIFLYYIWQFFLLLRHASPLLASAWYTTNGISGAVAAVLTGLYLDRIGAPLAMVLAMLAYVVGSIFIATAQVHQTYWANAFLCLLIIPFGMDISFPSATVVISDGLPREHQGMGASLVNTIINYSISIGLGIAGTVEVQVKMAENLLMTYC